MLGKKKMLDMITDLGYFIVVAEVVVEASIDVGGVASKTNAKRVGTSGWKRKDDGELPSNMLKKHVRGYDNFLQCQTACKEEATATYVLIRVMMLLLLMLMLMPMLMMIALTLLLLPDASKGDAYDVGAETKMPNVACHLAGANVVLLLLLILVVMLVMLMII